MHKLRSIIHSGSKETASPKLPSLPASESDIYKYRQQVGVNIGGWFILEKWIAPSMHEHNKTSDDSEFGAVSASVKAIGVEKTAKKWNAHYDSFVTGEDWKWLQAHHVNSVRVPLGYFCLGPKFTKGTSFQDVAAVYDSAWSKYKSMIEQAAKVKIGVLIDLHGLPGGANPDAHSGISGGGNFFDSSSNVALALECIEFITSEVKRFDNVIGIQIVNEASWGAKAENYYIEAARRIRKIDPSQIVVISDAWDRGKFSDFVQDKPGMLVDTHVYKCFSADDNKKHPRELIDDVSQKEWFTSCIIIGEYSCVFSGDSWAKVKEDERESYRKNYGRAQVESYLQKSAGFYFWTYKFEEGTGGEWGFREMVDTGCLPIPQRSGKPAPDGTQICKEYYNGHVGYWNNAKKGEKMEHWRYEDGFKTAWKDASRFWSFDESRIGQKENLKNARLQQHISAKSNSEYVWEFAQGYEAGLNQFHI